MWSPTCTLRCTITSTAKNKFTSVRCYHILDHQHVNVSLGDIELAFRLDYLIKTSASNKTGSARGRVLVDQTAYFTKQLLVKGGYLEWDPVNISALLVTYPLAFDHSEPKLDYDDKLMLESMLNGHAGEKKMKD